MDLNGNSSKILPQKSTQNSSMKNHKNLKKFIEAVLKDYLHGFSITEASIRVSPKSYKVFAVALEGVSHRFF